MAYGDIVAGAQSIHDRVIRHAVLAACAATALLGGPAAAQRPDAPFTGNTVPQGSPIPRILPPAPPTVAPGTDLTRPAQPTVPPAVNVAVRVRVHRRRHRVPARPAERDHRRADRRVGAGRPDRDGARGAASRSTADRGFVLTTVGATVSQAAGPALQRHRGAHRGCEARRGHRAGRRPGAAVPAPPYRAPADRQRLAGALAAAGAGRARRDAQRGAATRPPTTRARSRWWPRSRARRSTGC